MEVNKLEESEEQVTVLVGVGSPEDVAGRAASRVRAAKSSKLRGE